MSGTSAAGQATRRICCLATIAVAAACAPPRTDLPGPQADLDMRYSFASATAGGHASGQPWWDAFDDPLLAELVLDGLRRNAAVSAAQARVTQARANAEIEGVRFDPNIDASATLSGSTADDNVTEAANVSVSFPLDVSRRQQREQDRALIEVADALAARDQLVQQLSGDIALRFVRYSTNDERLRNAREDLRRRQTLAGAVESQVEAGDATQLDLFRARASALDVRAALRALEGEQAAQIRELTALLGGTPQVAAQLAPGRGPLWLRADRSPSAVPADLVRARPDIRRIELRYEAARTRVTDAEADRLPRVSITGSIGGSGGELGWQFGPSISLPPLTARVRDATVEREIAAAQAILFEWQDAVVSAVSEVEAAHARWRAARAQVEDLRGADREYAAALAVAEDLFAAGEITLLDFLDLQQARSETRRSLTDARSAYLEAFIVLNIALGAQDGLSDALAQAT